MHMSSMEITPGLQTLIDLVYPGLPHRQQASKARNDLIRLYGSRLQQPVTVTTEAPPKNYETSRDITVRIADSASAIDTTNWSLIFRNVQASMDAGRWDAAVEHRLMGELNMPFENAMNERRVQNSRIKAFFTQHLS